MNAPVFAIYNGKGGVGKTLTAVNLAALWAQTHRVLLIDLDPQYSASSWFRAQDAPNGTVADVLLRGASLTGVRVQVSDSLFVVPAGDAMESAARQLLDENAYENRLARALRHGRDFDMCVIDCPGRWDAIARNALMAATHMLVPVNSERMAFDCAVDATRRADELREDHEKAPLALRVLLTAAANRTINARTIETVCRETWPGRVCETTIRHTEKLKELSARWATVATEAAGTGREDYTALANELWAWGHSL